MLNIVRQGNILADRMRISWQLMHCFFFITVQLLFPFYVRGAFPLASAVTVLPRLLESCFPSEWVSLAVAGKQTDLTDDGLH